MDECVSINEEAIPLSDPFENPITDLPEPFVSPQDDTRIQLSRKRKAPPPARELSDVSELMKNLLFGLLQSIHMQY